MTLGDYMNQLAVSAGVASDDADLKTFLSSPSIMGAEFPKTVADKISSGLMTMDAARNNPNLHKHFFGLMGFTRNGLHLLTRSKNLRRLNYQLPSPTRKKLKSRLQT